MSLSDLVNNPLILLDAHCSAPVSFLGFSFVPANGFLACLHYFGVERLNKGYLRIKNFYCCFTTNCFEIFTHSKRDNVLYVNYMYTIERKKLKIYGVFSISFARMDLDSFYGKEDFQARPSWAMINTKPRPNFGWIGPG